MADESPLERLLAVESELTALRARPTPMYLQGATERAERETQLLAERVELQAELAEARRLNGTVG